MSKVSITRSLLDDLATSISAKSGEVLPLTLDEMKDAVDGIQTGGTLITKSITANGTYSAQDDNADGYSSISVSVSAPTPTLQTKSVSYTPSETAHSETVTADSGYDGLDEVNVSVGAISSTYVGSGITRRYGADITSAGNAVSIPEGYYDDDWTHRVADGTAGTPTATKGSVSNHSISVTPSVTNTTGYITGSTKTGTAVTVSASELVSGTYTVDSAGTKDVTNYASASVPSGTEGTPTATKGTVSNHSISVTPSVTNTGGYITGGTKTGTAVTVSASELASGNKAITQNGSGIDVVGYSTVSVNVAGAEYTRTVVCPQQTVSSSSRTAALANFPDGFIAGDYYIVTYDGTEYLLTAETMWSSAQVVGDFHIYYEVPGEYLYPFAMGSSGSDRDIAMLNTSQHTVKVEHLELITGGTTLTTKNITTNGTYNASSDNADGYSSVTVNVPSGSPTIQSLTVAPSTTQQTFNASGVDGYKPVTVAAVSQTNLTADNIKSGTTVTISNGTNNLWSVTGTYSGGGGGVGTLLTTYSMGTISTSSTQAADTGKSISVSDVNDYDLLIVETSVNTVTNNRHTATVGLIFLTASSTVGTKNGASVATVKWNSKISSSAVTTTRAGTTAYGIYPNSCSVATSNNVTTATIPMYQRYNSTSTGTINGNYTTRVYGVNLYDLIGG